MEALGRLFNIVPTADGVEVSTRDCSAVTFVCVGGNAETFTVQESTSAAGAGAVDLPVIDRYYSGAGAVGATAWVLETPGSATAVVTTTTAKPVAVIHVDVKAMSDGFDYLECTSSSTGLVYAITHDLNVQRDPANLPAPAA